MQKLTIVTSSQKKFNELSPVLNEFFECVRHDMDIIEIQGTPEEIVLDKSHQAYEVVEGAVLVDDVSFHMDALNGFPGPYMKDFAAVMTARDLGKLFAQTRATAACRLALKLSDEEIIDVKGEVQGKIIVPRIPTGYGFEPCFIPDGADKSFVEMEVEEKNNYSHRGAAVQALAAILRS